MRACDEACGVREVKVLRAKMRRVGHRLFHKYAVLAMEQWSAFAKHERNMRVKMQRVARRMFQKCLVLAFEQWRDNAKEVSVSVSVHNCVSVSFFVSLSLPLPLYIALLGLIAPPAASKHLLF